MLFDINKSKLIELKKQAYSCQSDHRVINLIDGERRLVTVICLDCHWSVDESELSEESLFNDRDHTRSA